MSGFPMQQPHRFRLRGIPRALVSTVLVASSFAAITVADIAPSLAAPPPGMFTQISAGFDHTCALDPVGSIWCWGNDADGQLGDGAATGPQAVPVQVDGSGTVFSRVAAGKGFTCALSQGGLPYCWGDDSGEQLGNGSGGGLSADQNKPVAVDVGGFTGSVLPVFTDIVVGESHACVIATVGRVYCWGTDADGQLGNGSTTGTQAKPVEIDATVTAVSLAASAKNGCLTESDGTASCWGDDASAQIGNGATTGQQASPVAVTLPTGKLFTSIVAGPTHACAIASDGTAHCWGSDTGQQLGNGATGDANAPGAVTMPAGKTFTGIDAGTSHTCALASDGAAWCWGDDTNGQLGNGTTLTAAQTIPVAVVMPSGKRFKAISTGAQHSCAISGEGLAYCWGSDASAQLGNGAVVTANQASPVAVTMPTTSAGWIDVSAGTSHTCAVASDGTVWCWGSDSYGQLGNGSTATGNRFSPNLIVMPTGKTFTQVSAGVNSTCAITTLGTAYCWGSDATGQLGNGGTLGTQYSPSSVSMPTGKTFTQLSVGSSHACAVASDGTVWCWGGDGSGQAGNGSATGNVFSPEAIVTTGLPAGTRFAGVTAGSSFTCAITVGGAAYCWGTDSSGQLGNDGGGSANVPSLVVAPGVEFVRISAGTSHACAAAAGGAASCWGSDVDLQLGNGAGTTANQVKPSGIDASQTSTAISAGGAHSCALRGDGGVASCWGSDATGQLGDDVTLSSKASPVDVAAGSKVYVDVDAGGSHTCAIAGDGSLLCWGSDASGQLGDGGAALDKPTPVAATALYAPVTVTVTLDGAGAVRSGDSPRTIDCPGDCTETYPYGTTVTLTAVAPLAQWPFNSWADGCTGTTTTCTLRLTAGAIDVTARFGAPLTFTKNGAAGGTVETLTTPAFTCDTTCAKVVKSYALNTSVKLTNATATNFTWRGWTGCTSASGSTCYVTMSGARSVTASYGTVLTVTKNFAARGTITSSPSGISCGATCAVNFALGTTITLTATLVSPYTAVAWTNCTPVVANPKTCTLTLTAPITVNAAIT